MNGREDGDMHGVFRTLQVLFVCCMDYIYQWVWVGYTGVFLGVAHFCTSDDRYAWNSEACFLAVATLPLCTRHRRE